MPHRMNAALFSLSIPREILQGKFMIRDISQVDLFLLVR
jgi:hypothetical protein